MEKRLYKVVPSNTVDTSEEWVLENDKEIVIYHLGGNSSNNNDVSVSVIWGTEILFCTHGDFSRECAITIVGNGTKKLFIKLDNDSSQDETIGAYYNYEETK